MSRNDNLIALRPVIESIDAHSSCSEAEQFQNKVLRPIIKFQHELIVVVFNAYLTKKRIDFISDTLEKKTEKLITIFKNDQFLIAELKGLIVSFFYHFGISPVSGNETWDKQKDRANYKSTYFKYTGKTNKEPSMRPYFEKSLVVK